MFWRSFFISILLISSAIKAQETSPPPRNPICSPDELRNSLLTLLLDHPVGFNQLLSMDHLKFEENVKIMHELEKEASESVRLEPRSTVKFRQFLKTLVPTSEKEQALLLMHAFGFKHSSMIDYIPLSTDPTTFAYRLIDALNARAIIGRPDGLPALFKTLQDIYHNKGMVEFSVEEKDAFLADHLQRMNQLKDVETQFNSNPGVRFSPTEVLEIRNILSPEMRMSAQEKRSLLADVVGENSPLLHTINYEQSSRGFVADLINLSQAQGRIVGGKPILQALIEKILGPK